MSKTTRIPGLVLTDHRFVVPVDHSKPEGDQITVFAREAAAPAKDKDDLPWMLFLQGGPGFPSPRPESRSGWLKRALQDYRVLLLDQRGTGLSTPVNYQTLARLPSPASQAEYLKNFRADAIVQDAEIIRKELVGNDKPWSVLGQSYGGFCLAHYLSAAPEGVEEAIFTGGLPPIGQSLDDIYRATYHRVIDQNRNYFNRYPDDQKQVNEVMEYLTTHRVELPGGGILTPHRFQQLGMVFGFQNGFETMHYLLEAAFVEGQKGLELNYAFLRGIQNMQPFDSNPIYAILHEPIYCEGYAPKWSADRIRTEFPEFSTEKGRPVFFTGEMIFPWMFDDYVHLTPLKEAANLLANFVGWPRLYNEETLKINEVPSVAAVYYDDMYVERRFSEETAQLIKGTCIWLTNRLEHSALRMEGEDLLDHLLGMLKGEV